MSERDVVRTLQSGGAAVLDETVAASALLPYEEVRDFFHYKNNYLHALDVAAEDLARRCGLAGRAVRGRVRPHCGPRRGCGVRERGALSVGGGARRGARHPRAE